MAVTVKNAVFWDVTPRGSCKNQCFRDIFCSVHRLLVMVSVVPSSPILVTLMMEALSSSEMLVLTRATQRKIPEDGILHAQSMFLLWHQRPSFTPVLNHRQDYILVYSNFYIFMEHEKTEGSVLNGSKHYCNLISLISS
jgi:hypothetical protein